MIYLDSNATTQVDPRVIDAMLPFLSEHYANPSASYASARVVRKALQTAREQVAALIDAEPDEIIFTSCGTESNNTAIRSAITMHDPRHAHFVTCKTEHAAVLEPARRWSEVGCSVSELDVDHGGRLDLKELKQCVHRGRTSLASIMWANNETGVIAPMDETADIMHLAGVMLHTDAVQAAGKLRLSVKETPVDFLSMSGHKFHAPKGVGALFISKRVRFRPWMLGGGQENGRRSGTENVPHIVAMGKAAELMLEEIRNDGVKNTSAMRDSFEQKILEAMPETIINGDVNHRLGTTSSLTFPGVEGAGLLILLDQRGVACSAGSACHTGSLHPSHVLEAMGCDAAHARCTLRFSWSRFNTMDETFHAADSVIESVKKMRALHVGDGPVIQW